MENQYRKYYDAIEKDLNSNGRRTAKLCLTPFYYNQLFWDQMDVITKAYSNLLEFVFQNFPVNKKIQNVLGYTKELENYLRSLNIYPINMAAARLDLFLTKKGVQMVESNSEIPGANEESYLLELEYLNILKPKNLKQIPRMKIVFNTLLTHYKVQAKVKNLLVKEKINFCIIQWQHEIDRIMGEYVVLSNYIKQQGHNCIIIDPNKLRIEDGIVKTPDGYVIDMIYRRFTADQLPKYAKNGWQLAIDLDKAKVAIANPFCTKRVDSKNIMVLFKDTKYDDIFPDELKKDLNIVRQIIPWTRKIEEKIEVNNKMEDTKSYLIANKNNLVVKHANSFSSKAVFIGEDADDKKWIEIVNESLKGDWIVQQVLDLPKIDIEYWEDDKINKIKCIYNVNPYIYGGKLGGFLVRASTDKLTSFTAGETATILPCFQEIK